MDDNLANLFINIRKRAAHVELFVQIRQQPHLSGQLLLRLADVVGAVQEGLQQPECVLLCKRNDKCKREREGTELDVRQPRVCWQIWTSPGGQMIGLFLEDFSR